jgi:Animal haem peroxidase
MTSKHSEPVRGLTGTSASPLFQGRFGRMFPSLPKATFGKDEAESLQNLVKLANAMTSEHDDPFDGKDDEESGIPALYTYLGQFIDHDLTFDPNSSLQKQNDPNALSDFRTPAFDLDNIYGRGPDDQPYMYDDAGEFLLGKPIKGANDANAHDLPRNDPQASGLPEQKSLTKRALIGDPRNDENAIVSQLQGLFHRFHNRLLKETRAKDPLADFPTIQRLMRFHYQYLIINDFLPRIVDEQVLHELKTDGRYDRSKLRFYRWRNDPFMPVEFSVAAYRLGHSMIRPGYRLNDNVLLPIFPGSKDKDGLTGFRDMNPAWAIDWGRFIDIDVREYDGTDDVKKKRLQFAYRIDTALVNPLSGLPLSVAADPPPSLPQRNLLRGFRLGLPSGQAVAHAMGVKVLDDEQILIGQAVDKPDKPLDNILSVSPAFRKNCPLWTYVLAEAMQHKATVKIPAKGSIEVTTPRLGPVGGRIVAEVMLGLMFGDSHSLLRMNPDWRPAAGPDFTLKDFVRYALGK